MPFLTIVDICLPYGLSLSSLVASLFALMLDPSMLSHHLFEVFVKELMESSVPIWVLIVTKARTEQYVVVFVTVAMCEGATELIWLLNVNDWLISN